MTGSNHSLFELTHSGHQQDTHVIPMGFLAVLALALPLLQAIPLISNVSIGAQILLPLGFGPAAPRSYR